MRAQARNLRTPQNILSKILMEHFKIKLYIFFCLLSMILGRYVERNPDFLSIIPLQSWRIQRKRMALYSEMFVWFWFLKYCFYLFDFVNSSTHLIFKIVLCNKDDCFFCCLFLIVLWYELVSTCLKQQFMIFFPQRGNNFGPDSLGQLQSTEEQEVNLTTPCLGSTWVAHGEPNLPFGV